MPVAWGAQIQWPTELITILIDVIPDDDVFKKSLTDFRVLWKDYSGATDDLRYWQDVASVANILSFLVVVLQVLLTWIRYGLDEWESSKCTGREVKPTVFIKLRELTGWLDTKQVWILIAGLILHVARR